MVFASQKVGFGPVARPVFHQCYQMPFGEFLQQAGRLGRGAMERSAQLVIPILDVVQYCQSKFCSEC